MTRQIDDFRVLQYRCRAMVKVIQSAAIEVSSYTLPQPIRKSNNPLQQISIRSPSYYSYPLSSSIFHRKMSPCNVDISDIPTKLTPLCSTLPPPSHRISFTSLAPLLAQLAYLRVLFIPHIYIVK